MKVQNENNLIAALNNEINLFVGSGFSTLAADNQGRNLPVGSQLRDELTTLFNMSEDLTLAQMATILNSGRRREFRFFLKERFTVGEFDSRYKIIERLPIRSIFTTNIDNLIHEIYKESKAAYINDLDLHGATFSDRNSIDYIALHGSVLSEGRDLSFDSTELASASAREPDRWRYLSQALESVPTLFCGYSLSDSGTLTTLHPSAVDNREFSDKWITVLPGTEASTIEYFKALKFQIIECDIVELLEYFETNVRPVTKHNPTHTTRELLPEWSIPDIGEVPVRPLIPIACDAAI